MAASRAMIVSLLFDGEHAERLRAVAHMGEACIEQSPYHAACNPASETAVQVTHVVIEAAAPLEDAIQPGLGVSTPPSDTLRWLATGNRSEGTCVPSGLSGRGQLEARKTREGGVSRGPATLPTLPC
jgi:hypothetical protein